MSDEPSSSSTEPAPPPPAPTAGSEGAPAEAVSLATDPLLMDSVTLSQARDDGHVVTVVTTDEAG